MIFICVFFRVLFRVFFSCCSLCCSSCEMVDEVRLSMAWGRCCECSCDVYLCCFLDDASALALFRVAPKVVRVSCDVYLCSLHSAHATLTIDMRLHTSQWNRRGTATGRRDTKCRCRSTIISAASKSTTTRTCGRVGSECSCDVHLCSLLSA